MYKLPPQQKQYLFRQHLQSRAASMSKATSGQRLVSHAAQASTYSPASGSEFRLVSQLTGDSGIMRRFSILGWGATTSPGHSPRTSIDVDASTREAPTSTPKAAEATPVQPQSTGGLWSSWWSSSGGEKGTVTGEKKDTKTPKWYVDGIRSGKPADIKLVKHLISLRVHLSTADLAWIEEFVNECQGMDALGAVLSGLVAKGGKRKKLQNVEESVLLETIKCIRVLLNTDVGLSHEFKPPAICSPPMVLAWLQARTGGHHSHYTSRILTPRLFPKAQSSHFRRPCCHLLCLSDRRTQSSAICVVRLSCRIWREVPVRRADWVAAAAGFISG